MRRISLAIGAICIATGLYLAFLTQAPRLLAPHPIANPEAIAVDKNDKLVIAQLGINLPILEGDERSLELGVWHRLPDRGNPADGGNFILSAHRFVIGATPGQTVHKSPFYNIDRLKVGDELLVDWQERRYTYRVIRKYQVKPGDTNIENTTDDAHMTLYSCTLGGSADGRVVIEAKL